MGCIEKLAVAVADDHDHPSGVSTIDQRIEPFGVGRIKADTVFPKGIVIDGAIVNCETRPTALDSDAKRPFISKPCKSGLLAGISE